MHPFNTVFERVIGHEGKFKREPQDRGDWTSGVCGRGVCKGTKYGISAMSYPHLDIENLTELQAKEIYYNDWWLKMKMESMPPALTYQLFDAAINHGASQAMKFLQKAVKVPADGIVGPRTLQALAAQDINDTLLKFLAERLDFFTGLSTWDSYGKGWSRRVATNLRYAAQDN